MNDAALCLKAAQEPQRDLVRIYDTEDPQGDMAIRTMGFVMNLAMKLGGSEKMKPRTGQGKGFFSDNFVEYLHKEKRRSRVTSWFRNSTLKRGIFDFLLDLNDTFSYEERGEGIQHPFQLQMSLVGASKAFLTIACKMEGLLSELAGYPEATKIKQEVGPDLGQTQPEAAGELSENAMSEVMRNLEGLGLS